MPGERHLSDSFWDGSLMTADLAALVDDLVAEIAVLHAALDGLRLEQWPLSTPAAGWSVSDHVSHLAYFDVTRRSSPGSGLLVPRWWTATARSIPGAGSLGTDPT
jgi:hypothetical protein